jgi:CubicO group peptidase (beta-lactamase class C family)
LSARDLARVGRLVADGGTCGKKKVLSPESVALLGAPATPLQAGQGLLWRLLLDESGKEVEGVYHDGSLGQWLVVLPKTKTVGVRLRRGKPGPDLEKAEFEFGGFASRLRAAAK